MPQFDSNFEFEGQTTETEVSGQEENEPAVFAEWQMLCYFIKAIYDTRFHVFVLLYKHL